jgi:hypothetical protein
MALNYWVNTSDNALIKHLLQRHAFAVEKDIQTLLEGGSIEKKLDEHIVFSELETSPRSLWNLQMITPRNYAPQASKRFIRW